jgi:4-carboxymuconolactone decarboxylase
MRLFKLVAIALLGAAPAAAAPERVAPDPMRRVAPALGDYTDNLLFGDVWKRPGLSARDRSLVTITILIAGGKSSELAGHLERALDNGLTPADIGGTITHLAFYAGWPNAVSATDVADQVFTKRRIPKSALQTAQTPLEPPAANDRERAVTVERTVTSVSPSLAQLTNGPLFGDLWRRSDLSPRDRSLVTIVALTANGDADQLAFHLQRGIENGLTEPELGEVMAHLAFYAGWPKAFAGTAALTKLKQATPTR